MTGIISLEELNEMYSQLSSGKYNKGFYSSIWSDHAQFEAYFEEWVSDHTSPGYPLVEYEKDLLKKRDIATLHEFICQVPIDISKPIVDKMVKLISELKQDNKKIKRYIDSATIDGLYDIVGGSLFENIFCEIQELGPIFENWAKLNYKKIYSEWQTNWPKEKQARLNNDFRWMYSELENKIRKGSADPIIKFLNSLDDSLASKVVSMINKVYDKKSKTVKKVNTSSSQKIKTIEKKASKKVSKKVVKNKFTTQKKKKSR